MLEFFFATFQYVGQGFFWRDIFFRGRGIRLACGICPNVELLGDVFQMPLQDVSSIEGASRWESKFFPKLTQRGRRRSWLCKPLFFFQKVATIWFKYLLAKVVQGNFYLKQVKPKAILPIRKLRQGNSGNSSHREIWWGWASQSFYRDSPGFGGVTSPAAMGARHLLGKVLHLHARRPLRWDKREFWRKLKKVHVEDYHSI